LASIRLQEEGEEGHPSAEAVALLQQEVVEEAHH